MIRILRFLAPAAAGVFFFSHQAAAQQHAVPPAALEQEADSLRALGDSLHALGRAHDALGATDSALASYHRAVSARRTAGDQVGESQSLNNIGNIHLERGAPDSALSYYRHSLTLARAANDRRREASTIGNMGLAWRDLGNPDSATVHFHSSLAIATDLGDSDNIERNLTRLAELYEAQGPPDSALTYYRRLIALAEPGDSADPWVHYNMAALFLNTSRLDSARVHSARAAQLYESAGESIDAADALIQLGHAHYLGNRVADAIVQFHRALALYRAGERRGAESEALHWLGMAHSALGAVDSAVVYVNRANEAAVAAGERRVQATTVQTLARIASQRGDLDSAHVLQLAALERYRELDDSLGAGSVLRAIGLLHESLGRLDSALIYLDSARAIQQAMRDWTEAARTLRNAAFLLRRHGRYDTSMVAYREALELAQRAQNLLITAEATAGAAEVYRLTGRPDSARVYALNAFHLQELAGGEPWIASGMLMLLGGIAGDRDTTLAYLSRALAEARESGEPDLEIRALRRLGDAYADMKATDSALAYTRRALDVARRIGDQVEEVFILLDLGHWYKHAATPDWSRAAAHYDSAWVVLEGVRVRTGDDATRTAFTEQFVNTARHLSAALMKRAEETGAQHDRWLALAAMERGRARGLLDMMRGRTTTSALTDLESEVASLRRALTREGLATLTYVVGRDTLSITLTLPSGRLEVFELPLYYATLGTEVSGMRTALGIETAEARTLEGALEADVADRLRGFEDVPGSQAALAAALGGHLQSLSDVLFPAPLRALLAGDSNIGEIVIIPDNVLALVPFAAVPFGSDGEPLGARYRLRYAPSLTALIEAERRPVTIAARGGRAGTNALVVGNPVMPAVRTATGAVEKLSQLAGAEREAIAVAQKLGAPMLRGAAASEAEVRERLPDAAIVHLATHGYAYASPARQRDSFIALAPGDGADGLLTVGEVIDAPQPLRADLVVLSACQTALGTRTMSEGTVGLQRAFLARGARSVLVSLWNVSDVVTERLMVSFYEHWTAGASKAEALRAAQEEVRVTHPNPRYWAAFQLVGAD